ncbi:MAG: Bacillibactin exporter [Candidatus Heimdallarchaeota archaeon LC_2]|nr:MAG: Bacillibactin exporter [Candidatus Heimdallarchaeota archaeon LC_2]
MSTENAEKTSLSSKEYILFLVSTLPVMAGATIAPALPEIAKAFPDESELSIQLILTITALFTAIGSLFVGNIIDKFGRRRPYIISIILYGVSGSSGLYLNSVGAILVSRAILGIAVAGVMTISITLVGDYYSGEFRNKIVGLQASFMTFGGVIFIFFGGVLAEIDWHLPFAIYLISFIFMIGVILRLDEPKRLLEISTVNAVSEHEHSIKAHKGVLLFAYSLGFITVMLFYFIIIFLPFYLEEKFNKSPTDIGLALSINSLFAGIASLTYKRLKSKYHYHALFGLLFIFMTLGSLIISVASSFEVLLLGLVTFGVGIGMFIPSINSWLFGQTHAPIRGRIIGGFTAFLFLGQFISPIVGNAILEITNVPGLLRFAALIYMVFAISFFVTAYFKDKT